MYIDKTEDDRAADLRLDVTVQHLMSVQEGHAAGNICRQDAAPPVPTHLCATLLIIDSCSKVPACSAGAADWWRAAHICARGKWQGLCQGQSKESWTDQPCTPAPAYSEDKARHSC